MTAKEPIVIHIGIQKAASTFLQYNVWPLFYPEGRLDRVGAMKLRKPRVAPLLSQMAQSPGHRFPRFISSEGLSTSMHPDSPGGSWTCFADFVAVAEEVRPKPRLIMLVRPQGDWLWSAYLQKTKKRRFHSDFSDYVRQFNAKDLSWADRVKELHRRFDQVLVMDSADLRTDLDGTLSRLATFLHRPKPSLSNGLPNKGPANVSPRTGAALTVSRLLYTEAGLWMLRRVGSRMGGTIHAHDRAIAFASRFGRPLKPGGLPPDLAAFCDDDWAETLDLIRARQP